MRISPLFKLLYGVQKNFRCCSADFNFTNMLRAQLIETELNQPEMSSILADIRDFKLGLIRSLTRYDLDKIERSGFKYRTKTLQGKREEVRAFILQHPSLMAGDVATIRENFRILGKIIKDKGTKTETGYYTDYSGSEEEVQPKKEPEMKTKPRIEHQTKRHTSSQTQFDYIELPSSSSDDDYNASIRSNHSTRSTPSHKSANTIKISQESDDEYF